MHNDLQERLAFLHRVVSKEIQHLQFSSGRVFDQPLDVDRAATLANDEAFAERVEAFASRFCRLQDTVGDKLLPVWLQALGEKRGAVVDNLDKAEKLGMLESADRWLAIRQIRKQMIHEYIESAQVLADALNAAHDYQEKIISFANAMLADAQKRGLI
ncbi:hypothetical protein [Halomonas cerina]|uniref:Uncharacterized protein n=1 Tax=Halomonas cerina TaxID=447424 RepID=A0A839V2P3_9GAMM|nr:hypothetical protein [Halomonas cerina]MBB3189431.1 hypothetical protein [Halomonas cerina]